MLTGGGDCPGLNAVMRAVVRKGERVYGDQLVGKVQEKGLTLVPTRLYWKNGRAKVELALARGKDVRDKRRTIADRDAKRQMERALKSRDRD